MSHSITRRTAAISLLITGIALSPAMGPAPTAQTLPALKLSKIVHSCKQFQAVHLHPARYIATNSKELPWPPAVYDIETGALVQFPVLDKLPGLPQPPPVKATGQQAGYERNRLKVRGDYWTWNEKRLVRYDPARGTAGLFLSQDRTVKIIDGAPACSSCRGVTEFIEQYGRYYCRACRKYVDEKDYLRDTVVSYYAELDLASRTVTWLKELERAWGDAELSGVRVIGCDPAGKYFYYSNHNYFYKRDRTTGRLYLNRFNIAAKKVDWQYTVPVPVRTKDAAAGTYDINVEPAPDFSRFLFWEYDEAWAETPGAGFLKKPGPLGFVVNVEDRNHFSIAIPVTPYGIAFNREGTHLVIGSNQTGGIHRISLAKKIEEGRTQAAPTIAKMLFTPKSKYLISINKRTIEVFAWPAMTKVQSLTWGQVIPGVKELLTAEQMHVMGDGRHAVIGALKPSGNGPWYSADLNDGFTLLQVNE